MLNLESALHYFANCPEFLRSGGICYSQNGEDVVIDKLLTLQPGEEKGCFVDFGAYHPYKFSNTFLLYLQGWRGVNVDANKEAIGIFQTVRKEDINVHALVAPEEKEYEYFKFREGAWNTTFAKAARELDARESLESDLIGSEIIKSLTPNQILEEHVGENKIDLLSIDIEGLDIEVLCAIDFERFKPSIICIEYPYQELLAEPLNSFISNKGYQLVSFCHHSAILQLEK